MTVNFPEFLPSEPGTDRPRLLARPAARPDRAPGPYRRFFKRTLDIALVVAAAPFVVPMVAGLALSVRRDGGPAFYAQERVGLGGRSFRMWKLRSMVADADARLEAHLAGNPPARDEWNLTQKLRQDPRVTPFGRFLRRSSLDELPQLWNVLRGDMSLVGPRPMMTSQRDLYHGASYYRLRPGITGHWQTAGRNATSFAARAEFDRVYEENLSLATDLRILGRTVGVVLKGTGC
ncbi:MAG: sugar transferase [Paracoccaceae bacterium]|nr:MAG: sugar transferase [Paracoccaceae bacterium]